MLSPVEDTSATSRPSIQAPWRAPFQRSHGPQYLPGSASALTVPSRHSHVPEVTPPPTNCNCCTVDIITGGTPYTAWLHGIKARHCPANSIGTNTNAEYNFRTKFLKMTFLSPLLRRKRRALTGGGPLDDLRDRDIAMARSRRFWSPQSCRLAPLFSAIFSFLGKKAVYPQANIGDSRTNFHSQ
jgi:hypothetical protein